MMFAPDVLNMDAILGAHHERVNQAIRSAFTLHIQYHIPILLAGNIDGPDSMSTSHDLVSAIKAELKRAGITYAQLAGKLGMAESSIKRIFAKGDMPLSRIDDICRALKLDFADLARQVADAQPLKRELTLAQERAVVADRRLLLVAICCLSQWTFDQIVASYKFSEVECIRYLARLDKLGIIELRPLNRYRLQVTKTFRWRPNGPVMAFFREHVVDEYFAGGFDGDDELLLLVHGSLGPGLASAFAERLQRTAEDFAQQHLADQRLPMDKLKPYTLVVGLRSWWYQAFVDLWRQPLDMGAAMDTPTGAPSGKPKGAEAGRRLPASSTPPVRGQRIKSS
jgi:transcriptional regulator with XRE-family HTH domain